MARMVRITLDAAKARTSDVDWTSVHATDEAEIRRHMIEDGEDPDAPPAPARVVLPAATVRKQLGLSQSEFARVIGVPLATVRNWEQGRVMPDAAARALLVILAREPKAALRALQAKENA